MIEEEINVLFIVMLCLRTLKVHTFNVVKASILTTFSSLRRHNNKQYFNAYLGRYDALHLVRVFPGIPGIPRTCSGYKPALLICACVPEGDRTTERKDDI